MNNQITLASFVKQECCNLVSGECLGLNADNTRFRNQGKCYITERRQCEYFTRVLLPLSNQKGCYDKIISDYQSIDLAIKKERVRQCECGRELSKRERFCKSCRKKRRQRTNRENVRKYRGST
jgi:hypothetical protein